MVTPADISKAQDDEIGDGTTTVAVLAGQLLQEAEGLLNQNIHPQTIVAGWRMALLVAKATLEKVAIDNSADEKRFRDDLFKIAKTTLSSKIVRNAHDHFANLAVDAIMRIRVRGGGLMGVGDSDKSRNRATSSSFRF